MEQPSRRRRPARSCLECRRRKIKCDRNDPCAHCVSAKTPCVYKVYRNEAVVQQQPLQGGSWDPRSSPLGSPSYQAPQICTNRPTIDHGNRPFRAATASTGDNQTPNALSGNHIQRPNTEPDLQDLLQRVQALEESSTTSSISGRSRPGQIVLARQSGLQDSQIILNKTRLLRWSHWMGTAPEFAPIIACYAEAGGKFAPSIAGDAEGSNDCGASFKDAEIRDIIIQIGDLLQKCKNIGRCFKVRRPTRFLSCPEFGLVSPSREIADTMVNLYLRSFESTHRILHVPTFWTEYRRYWNHPESITKGLQLKILLVVGIGSSLNDSGDNDMEFQNMVHQWIYAAQAWLSGPLEKDRLEINGLQVHCLTILAREIFSIGGDLVWMSMGSLIHRAMQVGLHRDPKSLPSMSILQAELRRRLWATILELVVQSSLDSAMPPRISFDEFDTEAPSNNSDDEIDESTTALQPHPQGHYTTTSIQLILLDSLPIRLQILKLLNGLHSELSYLDVLTLSSEITKKYQACNSFMKNKEDSGVTLFHRNLLDYLIRRFLIPLHCPFATKARTNPLFHYSLKVSLDTAMAIILPEPEKGFSRLMAFGGGMFREGVRLATTVISLDLIAQVEAQRLDGTMHRNSQHIELLKQAINDMIEISLKRIKRGETNVKDHMFLNMILARVEAIEVGSLCEFKIAQSARNSLEFCHDLLKIRAETTSLLFSNHEDPISTDFGTGEEGYGLDMDLEFFFPDASFS